MRRTHKKLWTGEDGGSVVEIALLSLLFFPIICYAAFFYDFSLASLKSLEASRYAAWELTAMKLWNWQEGTFILESGTSNQSMFDSAAQTITNEVNVRWGDDLNGATSSDGSYLFDSSQAKHSGLAMTTLKETKVSIVDGELDFLSDSALTQNNPSMGNADAEENTAEKENFDESNLGFLLNEIARPLFNALDKVANVAFEFMGFNTQGFAESQFSFALEFSKAAPVGVPVFSGKLFGDKTLFSNELVPAKQKILVDAWDLKDGADVDEGFGHHYGDKTDYYHQVGATYLLGIPRQAGNLGDLIIENTLGKVLPEEVTKWIPGIGDIISTLMGVFGVHNPLDPVVHSYRMRGFGDNGAMLGSAYGSCYPETEACIDFDKGPHADKPDGRNVADPPGAASRRKFYTNVFKDTHDKEDSPYYKVYERLGGYYMGCKKDSQKRCEY